MVKYVLFVCSENSARSQMAEAFFNFYNKNPGFLGMSAGLKMTDTIKPYAIDVMKEKGIDISRQKPKMLTLDMVENAHKIYTMGCIKSCPAAPPEKTFDWELEDPAGKPIEAYRKVRDDIEQKIKRLISEL
ncbi:MAG: arsenate reductase ArsC [Candidatus Altiarchaeota archaeon]|nr:arsenate reductase ArsC [Candidatus Altiarchaeota archaeon]